ncbi:MAG: DNA polymerase I [Bacteroidales bacterium]|nr:DNA polymerase I [Bacteroidales bacterium]
MNKLFLIDGHALIFKMYYAFLRRPMINSKGADMSVLFGFTKYLLELIEREQPTHLAVAFDPPGGTFRNQMFPEYKGTRPPTPQLIIDALEPLSELVRAMNIPVLMIPGYEADDVIGSMAVRSAREGMDVYMVTPDKDYGQLIAPHIFQYKPGKGGADVEIVDRTILCEKWGILDPVQIIDMLAICGDTSDNVPGVKGIGEVGAGKLVSKYGSVENIYAHLEELTPRQQAQFTEAEDHIALSKALVTIKTDIPLETSEEDMRLDMDYSPVLADLFEKYEFNSLKRHIAHLHPAGQLPQRENFEVTGASIPQLVTAIRENRRCSLITEAAGEGIFAPLRQVTLGADGRLAAPVPPENLPALKPILEDPLVEKTGYDLKRQSHLLAQAGISLNGKWNDIELMHYLLNPEKSHDMQILAQSYLGVNLGEGPAQQAGTGSLFDDAPEADSRDHTREAALLLPLENRIREEMQERQRLYDDMEEPLAKVLAKMERNGVKVDLQQLDAFAGGLRQELQQRQDRIRSMVGEPGLNISSPKQVGDVLFEKLKLDPKAKKSARGQYSTDEATLLAIAGKHPVVDEILEFRAVKKLLGTYIEPFPTYVSPVDGRVHTTFNQALTATGRLSSSNPNLQNIPIRTERGKEIRKAFIPGSPEGVIVSADYSQIELRIMAHLSCDEHLIKAFREGVDVHAATAAKIFNIPHEQVTREQRGMAKTANFGIMYGISSFGLAQRLHLGRKEAKELIDGYFASFPAIQSFIADSIAFARENGYVETLFGRRRYLPDINAKNPTVRALAERNAVNAPIQGTSADIIKLAMIGVDRRLTEAGLKSRMVLQIHDELVFDALPGEVEELKKIVVDVMENVIRLSVPLTVECNAGKNWLEAH